MASATASASMPGTRTSAHEDSGAEGHRRHAEWPQGGAAVIAAARPSSLPCLRVE
jgi:hypothetical protein